MTTDRYSGNGWTNTAEGAQHNAEEWVARMRRDGFRDIELITTGRHDKDQWEFQVRHTVTGVAVTLWIHGLVGEQWRAFDRERLYIPRTHWGDSDLAEPTLEDFAAPGCTPVMTYAIDAEVIEPIEAGAEQQSLPSGR